jgi:D-glycero-D-manno-heptose 1,7-bisphosphate phosphatase
MINGRPLRRVVFLDRDGVINRDSPVYVKSWTEFEFLPRSLRALANLTAHGFTVIVITNQSAVGRGLISAAGLERMHRRMCAAVAAHGGRIRDIFFCPHRPADRCRCRKPKPGLILRARQIHGIDLTTAIMVGDSAKDIACARSAGCRCALLVQTGNGLRAQRDLQGRNLSPDQMSPDLFQAAEWIIRRFPVARAALGTPVGSP